MTIKKTARPSVPSSLDDASLRMYLQEMTMYLAYLERRVETLEKEK